ncbi:hypothetical protein LJR175_007634 [Variovorax sp. LjRoot175]|uniref:Dyp-type peroxidase n=1 Tax=Variovorax sp. LjRoot175 TaxID=3342276 RepID=UPI003ECE74E3
MNDFETFRQEFDDIPALVGTGFPELRRARYLLIHITHAQTALTWLQRLLGLNLVHSLGRVRCKPSDPASRVTETVTLGFSHAGLIQLGLKEDKAYPFPSAFRDGMAGALRRQLLGDPPNPAWQWGDVNEQGALAVHIFVVHYWSERISPSPHLDPAKLPPELKVLLHPVSTCPSYIEAPAQPKTDPRAYEPFGFRDGIGQPVLDGIPPSKAETLAKEAGGKIFEDRIVQPGEFVLGQHNEYKERAYCPNVQGWQTTSATSGFGRNGTYIAVRQIEQHVSVFSQFVSHHPSLKLDELFVGRKKPRTPPAGDDGYSLLSAAQPPSEIDAFRYLETDANGFECPRGAHARRANPRDALAQSVEVGIARSKLHRLLRRGRVYAIDCPQSASIESCGGHPRGREGNVPCGRGLMFMALNADFERQFEFVQRSWIAGSRFGDLSDEQDPLLGTDANRAFTLQGCPVGQRISPLPRFTTVWGGGYFFVPSLSALKRLADGELSMHTSQ